MDVISYIEKCLIPKLSINYDASQRHAEYEAREVELQKHFDLVLNGLKSANLKWNWGDSAKILSAVLILYYDLLSKGPWASNNLREYANKLSAHLESLYNVTAADLMKNDNFVKSQAIFDECMKALHLKLTSNDFKKYPSLIEVYYSLIENQDFKNVEVNINHIPISLCLIDDFNLDQKKKGLQCCEKLLTQLHPKEFETGNYYEVIHASLKRAYAERNVSISGLAMDCFQQILRLVLIDSNFKTTAADELFTNVLEQIQSEPSLYRKAAMFRSMRYLIETSGVNFVRWKTFQTVVCYNLDICCTTDVDEIMLVPILVCLEEWVNHCWCVWRLDTGHSILSALLKVLYVCKENRVEQIVKIIATLITLCTSEEKQTILAKLQETRPCNEQFNDRLNLIYKRICVN